MGEERDWSMYVRGVGDRVRHARLEAGLTQSALASQSGVSLLALQRVERGDRFGENKASNPTLKTMRRIALALNSPLADLLS